MALSMTSSMALSMTWTAMAANAWTLLSYEGAQAALVIAIVSLVSLRSRHPIKVAAGD
ncbi:MAG: hypothetical protein P4M07_03760 [Xanthobacteraceae bacterium]|nr:hypothetical protein [Xanthobacteraceae bacterium]